MGIRVRRANLAAVPGYDASDTLRALTVCGVAATETP